jgi:hypothetical protein
LLPRRSTTSGGSGFAPTKAAPASPSASSMALTRQRSIRLAAVACSTSRREAWTAVGETS